MVDSLRVDDPELRYAAVRLCSDLPLRDREFVRENGGWILRLPAARLARLEYQLELADHVGNTQIVCDPGNPVRAPGAFGEKSVVLAPNYRPPTWLREPHAQGSFDEVGVRVLGRPIAVRVWSPAEGALPLLVAHDGPEYDALAGLTRYAAAMIERGAIAAVSYRTAATRRPRRVVFGLGGLRSRALSPDHPGGARPGRRCRSARGDGRQPGRRSRCSRRSGVGRGCSPACSCSRGASSCSASIATSRGSRGTVASRASSPACCARRRPRSGASDHDVRRRGGEHPQQPRRCPSSLAAQGYPARLHEVADLHNYTSWRDAFDPHLTQLLARVWARP